jgi:hypothetical protein
VSGTFAWTQVVSKTNEFIGSRGIVLHDDFDPEFGKKDVYVEKVSSRYIFTRVKLGEYMDLESNAKPGGLDATENYDLFFKNHINPLMASITDSSLANQAGEKFNDYFKWSLGGEKLYYPATAQGHADVDTDPTSEVFSDVTHYDDENGVIKKTPYAQIVTVDEYRTKSSSPDDPDSKLNFLGWIYDPASGDPYAYWSQPLGAPVAATKITPVTGLLLSGVETSIVLTGRLYYYSIKVIAEAVDLEDLPMWTVPDPANPGMGMPASDQSGLQYPLASDKMRSELKNVIVPIAYPEP